MSVKAPTILDRIFYERAARDYCESLPLEHFMESTPQQAQRKMTLSSFELVHRERPDVWCYNELLIQYPVNGDVRELDRVVPDNLIVLHDGELNGTGSFNTPFEQAQLLMAMEYVSPSTRRKDYEDNLPKYEVLRMPYYLIFEPEMKEIVLFRLNRRRTLQSVKPNAAERYAIPEIELEIGLYDGWMRYWFRETMLPLPAELAQTLCVTEQKLSAAEGEIARLKAELAKRSPKS
jgi:Uma2 family endonuclease